MSQQAGVREREREVSLQAPERRLRKANQDDHALMHELVLIRPELIHCSKGPEELLQATQPSKHQMDLETVTLHLLG